MDRSVYEAGWLLAPILADVSRKWTRFRDRTCAKSRTYNTARERFFTRHAVGLCVAIVTTGYWLG